MTIRILLCLFALFALAALMGAMERCGTLAGCLQAGLDGPWSSAAHATTLPDASIGMTPDEALAISARLDRMRSD